MRHSRAGRGSTRTSGVEAIVTSVLLCSKGHLQQAFMDAHLLPLDPMETLMVVPQVVAQIDKGSRSCIGTIEADYISLVTHQQPFTSDLEGRNFCCVIS